MTDSYYALDEHTAIDYVRACAAIHALLPPGEPLLCDWAGGRLRRRSSSAATGACLGWAC